MAKKQCCETCRHRALRDTSLDETAVGCPGCVVLKLWVCPRIMQYTSDEAPACARYYKTHLDSRPLQEDKSDG